MASLLIFSPFSYSAPPPSDRRHFPSAFSSSSPAAIAVRCGGRSMDPLKPGNGAASSLSSSVPPRIPLLNGQPLPGMVQDKRLRIFSGTANPALSKEIASYLGLNLGKIKIERFADGEIYVELQETVRGCDVFIVQPTCPPTNENLIELLVIIDACSRADAKTVSAVIPYYGYARADRKERIHFFYIWRVNPTWGYLRGYFSPEDDIETFTEGCESVEAKLVANLITEAGATRVLSCDIHSSQTVGCFDLNVDQAFGQHVILDYLTSKKINQNDLVVVSPHVGGVARAQAFAKKLSDSALAIVDKRRPGHNVAEVLNLIGDVKGKISIMVDDMIDTAGTIARGAELLHQKGAREVYACSTHAVFSPPALERLSSGLFQEVIVTNTIPVSKTFPQLTVLSVAKLLAETIAEIAGNEFE